MADDQSTGVVSPLRNAVTQFAGFRWAQGQHSLLYGPTRSLDQGFIKGGAKSIFSWRATEEEMTRMRSGVTVGGRIQGAMPFGATGDLKARSVGQMYGSWMNSPFSFTKWTTSAQLMHDPGRYTKQASRFFAGDGFVAGNMAERSRRVGMFKSTHKGILDYEKRFARSVNTGGFDEQADIAYAREWTSKALGFGGNYKGAGAALARRAGLASPVNRMLNFSTGMMFEPGEGTASAKALKMVGGQINYTGASKFLKRVADIHDSGASIAAMGDSAEFALSKFGTAVAGGAKFVGGALSAYGIYSTAKMIGEGAYNLGEAAFYSPAKRGLGDLNTFATRGMFSPIGPQGWISGPTGATNRARSVQAIQGSKMNARSALGNEASLLQGHFG